MDAKDILDIQISADDLVDAEAAFDEPLRRLGFRQRAYNRDHAPAGSEDDAAAWVKRFWCRRDHDDGDVNLHVRLRGSPNERLALLFRDWMRAHPQATRAYASFKHSLAESAPDLDTYTVLKDPVVDLVIAAAEEWTTTTGWSVDATT
jgi:GrpB-like predicted nucleotidyltransferase (UPF0157 family)